MSLGIIQKEHSLSQLLPYNPADKKDKALAKSLKEYAFLLNASQQAIAALKTGELEKFDSMVGENACQIRAIRIAIIASKTFHHLAEIEEQIEWAKKRILELSPSIGSIKASGKSLQDLLIDENLDINLSSDDFFLIRCFLLSVAKEIKPEDPSNPLVRKISANPQKLQKFGHITSSFAQNIVSRLRLGISNDSVKFVQQIVREFRDPNLENMVSQKFVIKYQNWLPCLPMFWTYKTLLLACQRADIPIIFHAKFLNREENFKIVRTAYLFFQPANDRKGSPYEEMTPIESDLKKSACIFEGTVAINIDNPSDISQWKNSMRKRGIGVILAGAADHVQYPENIPVYESDQEYEDFRQIAVKEGFSIHNPKTFFIQHVYATSVRNVPQLAKEATNAQSLVQVLSHNGFLGNAPQRIITVMNDFLED